MEYKEGDIVKIGDNRGTGMSSWLYKIERIYSGRACEQIVLLNLNQDYLTVFSSKIELVLATKEEIASLVIKKIE